MRASRCLALYAHLPKVWRLAIGDMFMNEDGIARDSFSADVVQRSIPRWPKRLHERQDNENTQGV
jgi:hypothetical protein